jgi:hypothetical protein
MRLFPVLFALTVLLGIVAILVGRLVAVACRMPLLKRRGPESLLACAFLGTGTLILAYGWGSWAGLPARHCLFVVGAMCAVLAAFLVGQGRLREVVRLPSPRLPAVCAALALAAPVAVFLAPLILGGGYWPYSDAIAYTGTGEWLQNHGYGPPPEPIQQPVDHVAAGLRGMHHRMGPMYLLALLRSALPFLHSFELYPVVMGWGAALNIAGIFLLCRWTFRLSRYEALGGALVVGVAFNSLCLATTLGFLCQVYGTAVLAFLLALLSRLLAPVQWRFANALLLGIGLSLLVSVYNEIAPVFCLAGTAAAAWALWRVPARGRLLRFLGLAALSAAVIGNLEYVRGVRATLFMLTELHGAGWHLPWSDFDYGLFALGFYPFDILNAVKENGANQVPVAVAAVALLAGLAYCVRKRRTLPLAVTLLVLAALFVHYRLWVRDPWTGEVGHTFYVFEVCKWAFPFIAATEVAGLCLLLRRLPRPRVVLVLLCAASAVLAAKPHGINALRIVATLRQRAGPEATLTQLRHLRQRIAELNPRYLYLVTEPDHAGERCTLAHLLYPRPFVNGWKGSMWFAALADDQPEMTSPETLFLMYGEPDFGKAKERLPAGYSIIDGTRPLLFRVENANGLEKWGAGNATWVGDKPAVLWAFAPRATAALLSFEATPGPSLPGTSRRTLCLKSTDGTTQEITVDAAPGCTARLPVQLPAGVSRLELVCTDRPVPPAPGGDPRVMLMGMVAAQLDPVPSTAAVIRVENVNGVEQWAPGGATWVGEQPAVLWTFAPRATTAVLAFEATAGPSLPDTPRRTLRLKHADGTTQDITIDVARGATVRVPVQLPAGMSRLELVCTDRPTTSIPGDARVMLVGVIAARLDPLPAPVNPPARATPPARSVGCGRRECRW